MDAVALTSAVGSLVLGAVGIISGEVRAHRAENALDRRAREQRVHDRELLRGELSFNRKDDAYRALLTITEAMVAGWLQTLDEDTGTVRNVEARDSLDPEAFGAMRVQLLLHGSPAVRDAYSTLGKLLRAVVDGQDALLGSPSEEGTAAYRKQLEEMKRAANALNERVREDLDGAV